MEIIGNNLLILREALNLTQAEVVEAVDMSRDYLSRIETGARPSAGQNIIRLLATKLSSTEEWLTKGTGWTYWPPATHKALAFVERQINKFPPNEIIIVTYSFSISPTADDNIKANGFIFMRPNGPISMEGSQTLSGYDGKGPYAYRDSLIMIRNARIKTGRIELDKRESKYLIHANLLDLAKRAKYDGQIIEKELHALMPGKFPKPATEESMIDTPISLTVDEASLLLAEMKKTKTDLKELLRYMRQKTFG